MKRCKGSYRSKTVQRTALRRADHHLVCLLVHELQAGPTGFGNQGGIQAIRQRGGNDLRDRVNTPLLRTNQLWAFWAPGGGRGEDREPTLNFLSPSSPLRLWRSNRRLSGALRITVSDTGTISKRQFQSGNSPFSATRARHHSLHADHAGGLIVAFTLQEEDIISDVDCDLIRWNLLLPCPHGPIRVGD
jgi:hypothetical protein